MKAATSSIELALTVLATSAGIAALYFLRPVIIPFVLALVLVVLVNGLVRFIENAWRSAPHWAVRMVAALVVLIVATGGCVVLAEGTANIVRDAPQLIDRLEQLVTEAGRALGLKKPLHLATLIGEIDAPKIAGSVAGSIGDLFSALVLLITYFAFLLAGRARTNKKLAALSALQEPLPLGPAVLHISKGVETYLWVHVETGTMLAGVSAIVMLAVGLNNALFWAVMLFLLDFIPVIGVTVGSIVATLFALMQFPDWWHAAFVFVGIQAAATFVGNVIYPKLQAQTQNIDPVATIFALAFWGFLWGIIGAFLAVPLTAIVMMVCAYFPRSRWLAILLSNDPGLLGQTPGARRSRTSAPTGLKQPRRRYESA